MTKRERVIAALNHRETDIVPYQIDFTKQAAEKFIAVAGEKRFYELGSHIVAAYYSGCPRLIEGKKEHYIDDFGVVWNRSGADKDIGVIDSPIVYEPDISLRPEPAFDEGALRKALEHAVATKGDRFLVASLGFSLFERFWSYTGMEDALVYMIAEPEFTNQMLDKICDFNCKIIDIYNEYSFDAILFGDDWGQQKGLIMGSKLWRQFIKPRVARMYDKVKENGKYVMQHSCGDISEIFPDLIEIGLDCYQTFQPEIYDIESIKRGFGDKLSFWGGISTQQLLPFASPQKVKEETRRIMDILSKGGGYIAAPTHSMPGDIPVENMLAMIEVFENQ